MARKTPARESFAAHVKKELRSELEARQARGELTNVEIVEPAPRKTRKEKIRERLVEMGDGGFDDVRRTYRLALHHHETQKRRMKAAKNRVEQTEGDLRNAAQNVPFNPGVMGELAGELAKHIIAREGTERDLKRTRANLRAATESYVAFEEEDQNRGT